ncbi:MAG: hypothetical protein EOO40_01195 [Deltaproteobacteria bacterium]|nr:MAG: hypothetical protein EOO40_01195 [Deltaproteobacteria bacterium]
MHNRHLPQTAHTSPTSSTYSLPFTLDADLFDMAPAVPGRPRPDSYVAPPHVLNPSLPPSKQTGLEHQRYSSADLSAFLPPPARASHTQVAPMALFEIALSYVLINEGSTFTDDPSDRGGSTRYGVTQGTLANYLGRPTTPADVQALTPQMVSDIYRKLYWTPIKGDQINKQAVATVTMDLAVLCGPGTAARMLQAAVGATQDGNVGPMTLAAVNKADAAAVVQSMSLAACNYFASIATRDVTQQKWLAGWQYRAHKMTKLLLA